MPWPYNGDLRAENTALLVIDMQIDFCGVGGYVDKMGYDLSLTRAAIAPIQARAQGRSPCWLPCVSHPRRAPPRPERLARQQALAVAPDRRRHRRPRAVRTDPGPGRAWLGDHPELAPAPGEPIIDKPGKGAFYSTDLELMLQDAGDPESRPHRHHHGCLCAYDDAGGQRPGLRVLVTGGLLRRHRPREPPGGHQDDQDAGWGVRERVKLEWT